MSNFVAKLIGGPANGLTQLITIPGLPNEVTVPAGDFGGWVDAVYVGGQGSHSVGNGPEYATYTYRLPNGSLDDGPDRLDRGAEEMRRIQGNPRSAVTQRGLVNVWYADGPRAGTADTWASAADHIDPSQHVSPGRAEPYDRAGRLEVRDGTTYEIYLFHP